MREYGVRTRAYNGTFRCDTSLAVAFLPSMYVGCSRSLIYRSFPKLHFLCADNLVGEAGKCDVPALSDCDGIF